MLPTDGVARIKWRDEAADAQSLLHEVYPPDSDSEALNRCPHEHLETVETVTAKILACGDSEMIQEDGPVCHFPGQVAPMPRVEVQQVAVQKIRCRRDFPAGVQVAGAADGQPLLRHEVVGDDFRPRFMSKDDREIDRVQQHGWIAVGGVEPQFRDGNSANGFFRRGARNWLAKGERLVIAIWSLLVPRCSCSQLLAIWMSPLAMA